MEFSTALAAQLATLGSAAGELPDAVDELHGLLLAVVPSAVGLSITVHISDVDLTLTTLPEGVKPKLPSESRCRCGQTSKPVARWCSTRRRPAHWWIWLRNLAGRCASTSLGPVTPPITCW